jgi:two-component system LytT family response regulator
MLKVMVADDERIAREIIVMLLRDQKDIAEVQEAKDGNQALQIAQQQKPDIVFLDIQMPGQTGVQLAEKLGHNCCIIFVTAYDRYAVNAFELSAIDYLLKPFEDKRFYLALDKARRHIEEQKQTDFSKVAQLLKHLAQEQSSEYKSRLVIKEPGRIRLLDVDKINFISGAGNYAQVHMLDGTQVLHRETLTSLENQLDPSVFLRIHRSSIIRHSSVSEIRPNDKGDYAVVLKSGEVLTLSRRNKVKLAELLA